MKKKVIYLGCSLTHATEEFKNAIEDLKKELRSEYIVTDFLGLEKGTVKDAYEFNLENVRNCDLFIAECSYPSTGLGVEIGFAVSLNKPIIAVAHKDAKVSRLVQGVTHPKYTFKRYEDMIEIVNLVKERVETLEQ